jgi:hypothetical protein
VTAIVTALDAYANQATRYNGTVRLASTDPASVLPATTVLVGGLGTFSVNLRTAGNVQVTVTDLAQSTRQGSAAVAVSPAAASRFSISLPASAVAGSAINATVIAFDPFGNVATGYAGKIHFASTDVQALLPPDSTLSAGQSAFSITLRTAAGQIITATDVAQLTITGTSGSVAVTPLAATHLALQIPVSVDAGRTFSVTVAALDPFGNLDPSYNGTVHFSSSDAAAALPASGTIGKGTGTFMVTLWTLGNQTVTVTDSQSGFTASSSTFTMQAYVAQIYHDLLHRQADAGGMVSFGNALMQGRLSPAQIAAIIEGSKEYRSDVVQGLYAQLLLRAVDSGGLQGWLNFLANGGTDEQVEAAILSSTEYLRKRGGGSTAGFLAAVYQDVLGRPIDSAGAAAWSQQMQHGMTRNQVAAAILGAREALHDRVQSWYSLYLHRSADSGGLSAFTEELQQGSSDEQIILALVSSQEYIGKTG